MASAAYIGESVAPGKEQAAPEDDDFVAAAALVSKRTRPKNDVVSRLGLEVKSSPKTMGETVQEHVKAVATEASSLPLPADLIKKVSAQVLAALAATAVALPAWADDAQPAQIPQMQPA